RGPGGARLRGGRRSRLGDGDHERIERRERGPRRSRRLQPGGSRPDLQTILHEEARTVWPQAAYREKDHPRARWRHRRLARPGRWSAVLAPSAARPRLAILRAPTHRTIVMDALVSLRAAGRPQGMDSLEATVRAGEEM